MIVRSFLLLLGFLLTNFCLLVYAGTTPEQIRSSVSNLLVEHRQGLLNQYGSSVRIEYEISNLDPRLSMATCPVPLTAVLRSTATIGQVSVKVSCLKDAIWSLYVPAEIKLYRQVVVTTMPLARQTLLSESTLQLREMDVSKLRGTYFTTLENALGMQTKRSLSADTPVTANHIEPPVIIKKGDSVLITASTGALVVKIPGKALMDGRIGQQISVQNRQSKRIIDAKVIAPAQVIVPM